ncbi:MAG: hypothetical protein A3E83_05315 [Gammaproteobacteria bacterium RIFCSPHIGHO2_12_FULL_41_20]|nr:MAG: hypothetical protein A3E83_05315 [Gammaproteobacteria bacterium RIFCSPHIGHO2_12_FULL_41_20]
MTMIIIRILSWLALGMPILLLYSFPAAANLTTAVVTCKAENCPSLPPILPRDEKLASQAIIYQTSSHPEFMTRYSQSFSKTHHGGWQHITVNETALSQTHPIIGFGGAFTDSTAILYQHLSPALKQALIDAYFSPQGIEYSLGRVPMASSDFSCRNFAKEQGHDIPTPSLTPCSNLLSPYSYADKPDYTLSNFALQPEDLNFKIPMIHAAQANSPDSLKLFASPWSAPAWMKTNGSMIHGSLNPALQPLWAEYFVKFLHAYQQHGITFWGLTVQNEPVNGAILGIKDLQSWQTMYSSTEEEAIFIKNYLGPALKQFEKEYHSKIHLMIHDDQIINIHKRTEMLNDPEVAQYVDGTGLHWYVNYSPFLANLDKAYQMLDQASPKSQRFIIGTEACTGSLPMPNGPALGNWARGESYAHDIIQDLNHHVSGWTDWNLLLDTQGGPNWAKNYVDAPIIADLQTQTLYKQPMYYYLGHFSKFIRPGSQLLASQSLGPAPLEEVTFKVPAHANLPETIVIVVLNRDITSRSYYIYDQSIHSENAYLNMHIPAHAIQTIIYKVQV